MNAKCYRTVFNAVRGMLVAVEESARSTGKGRQSGGQAGTSVASTSSAARFAVLPVVFGAWCALGLPYTVHAQVVAAPGSGAQVIQTQNGLQQVNVARPNGSGVSLNTYTQFSVPSAGTILNNAPGITQTQQAGYINGNPNLLPGGSARIIVNQVTSTSPSTLRGYLEVAGPRAEVVIANPNGILVNGGGFVNTSRATLTTGVPVFGGSGSLDAYRVTGGQITVQGAGLNASNVDQVDLIARAVSVNASVYANQLNVVAGANQVDRNTLGVTPIAGDGAATANGIDVSQLGGMYANKILLASTEKGVGVSLRGVAAAQAGDLTLTSQGKLVLAGQTNASGNLSVSAQGGIDNTGTTYGRQSAAVSTSGDLTNSGTLAAQQNLSVNANNVNSGGTLGAGVNSDGSLAHAGDLSVVAGGAMSATGQNVAGGNATLQGASVNLAGSQTSANGNLNVNAQAGNLDLTGATTSAGGTLNANAQGALINDRGHLSSQGAATVTAGSLSNQGGQVVSQNALSANVAGALSNQGGTLQAAGALNANTGSLDNTAGHIASLNTDGLNLTTAGRFANGQGGMIGGNGNVTVQVGQLSNTGTISAVQNLGVSTAQTLTNAGTLAANGNTTVSAGTTLTNAGGTIAAGQRTNVSAATLDNSAGTMTGNQLALAAANLINRSGTITQVGTGPATIAVSGTLDNTRGTLQTNSADLALTPATLINDHGRITVAGTGVLSVATGALSNQGGQIATNGTLKLQATDVANQGGTLSGTQQVNVATSTLENGQQGTIESAAVSIAAQGAVDNTGGTVNASGALDVSAASLVNTGGTIQSSGAAPVTVSTTGRLTNGAGGFIGANGNVAVSAGQLSNTGRLASQRDLLVNVGQTLDDNGGAILANGNATVKAGTLSNAGGTIAAGQKTSVTAATLDNSAGTLTGNQLALAVANLFNRSGTITQAGTGPITIGVSGTFDNTGGALRTNSADLTLAPATLINDHGTITDAGTGTLSVTTGNLSNTGGTIATNGALDVQAGAVSNQRGKLSAQSQATLNVASLDNSAGGFVGAQSVGITDQGALNNAGGTVAASGALTVSAGAIANAGGAIKNAGTQATRVSASQSLDNTQGGLIGGNGEVSVSGGSVDNSGGTVVAGGTAVVQSGSTLRNAAGRVQAKGSAAVTAAGAITNTGGQIEADGAAATLQVTGASLDNTNGRIANAGSGATTVGAASITNANTGGVAGAGTIGGNGDVTVSGQTLSNTQGGQIVAGHDLTLANTRSVNNSGGTLSAANNFTVNAAGAAVVNQAGSMRGNGAVSLNVASLDNTAGKIGNDAGSGGSVAMTTGSLANQGGAIGSDRNLSVTTGQLSGDGRIIAGGDGAITINGNYTHSAANQIQANHNLTFTTTGTLTNQGTLAAVNELTVNAASVDNRAGADLNSASTAVNAGGAITNAGRIEGDTVSTQSGSLDNTGTVIGNNVTLNARAISNTGPSAALAAATQLNLYASDSLSNTGGATIFSLGDVNIAANGARDGNGLLANRANLVNNDQSTIEAQGNLEIAAQTLNNTRPAPTVQTVTTGTTATHETKRGKYMACATMNAAPHGGCTQAVWNSGYKTPIDATFSSAQIVSQSSGPNPVDNVLVVNVNGQNQTIYYNAVTNNGNGTVTVNYWDAYDPHTNYVPSTEYATRSDGHNGYQRVEIARDTTTTTQQDQVTGGSAPQAQLLSGRNMTLANVGTINNNYSAIAAGGSIRIGTSQQGGAVGSGNYGGTTVNNVGRTLYQYQTQNIVSTYAWNEGTNQDVGAVAQAPVVVAPVAIGGTGGTLIANNAVQINATNLNNTNVAAASSATGATGGTLGANAAGAAVSTTTQPGVGSATDTQPAVGGVSGGTAQTVGTANARQTVVNAPQSVAGSNGALNISLPTSGLFSLRTAPGQPYLIATDPRLTSYTKFISSDYMLSALNLNPQQVQKRLGDGFYEEKLVRDQITQLTGRVRLQGYGNNEDQYRALMASGVNAAKQFSLVPGIALTAAQMDALTSDIVWLVSQTVTLPDGSTQQVLAPVVYLAHTHANDLQPTGALIAADDVEIHAVGSATNSGVIKGGTQTVITATDIINRGGTIASDKTHGTTVVSASHDILNASGEISGNRVAAQAGHDIVNTTLVDTVQASSGNSKVSTTLLGRQGTIAATGDLLVQAGNDLTVRGANVTAGGNARVSAGHDLVVDTVQSTTAQSVNQNDQHHWEANSTTHQTSAISAGGSLAILAGNDAAFTGATVSAGQDLNVIAGGNLTATTVSNTSKYDNVAADSKTRQEVEHTYNETAVGTTFSAGGNATLAAVNASAGGNNRTDGKGNVTLTGSSLTAGTNTTAAGNTGTSTSGTATIVANGNVTLNEAREEHDTEKDVSSRQGSFVSSTSRTDNVALKSNNGVGSLVSGNAVAIGAGKDVTVQGSAVAGTNDVAIAALGNVNVVAARNTAQDSELHDVKQSGLSGSGGLGFTIGSSEQKEVYNGTAVTESQSRSTVGSVQGNVSISAGKDAHIGGSDIVAGKAATDTTGSTGNISIKAQNIMIDPGQDTSQSRDQQESRSSGLTVAVTGTPYDTVRNLKSATSSGNGVQRARGVSNELAASGLDTPSVSLSYSHSSSSNTTDVASTTNMGSTIRGGGNVTLTATGGTVTDANGKPLDGDITVTGSTITSGGVASFDANRNVTFQASTDQYQQSTQSSNSSTGIQLAAPSFGDLSRWVNGGPNSSGVSSSPYNASRGSANGNSTSNQQTATVVTGNSVIVKSHTGDINVIGSGISGTQGVDLVASQGAINVLAGTDTSTNHQESSNHQIGSLGSNGTGTGFSVGVASNHSVQDNAAQTQSTIRSQIVSQNGNVTLDAKQDVSVQGADVTAGKDLTLIGKNLNLDPGTDGTQSSAQQSASQYGVTLALGGVAGNAVATINQSIDNASRAHDSRLTALNAAQAGLAAYGAYQAATATQPGSQPLVKVTVSVGGGTSSSESQSSALANKGSTLTAGGNVNLVATGSGAKDANGLATDGDINSRGTQITGQNVTLNAARDINLQSAQDTSQQTSSNRSSNASIGVGFGLGGQQNGFTLELAAGGARGNANGNSVTNQDTQITAGNTLTMTSGRDTNLRGAEVAGNSVVANVGRDLNIQSPQDTNTYNSQQTSVGAQVSLCIPPFCYGTTASASANASDQTIKNDYQSVNRQSGIYAGNGGFNVNVGNHTQLDGGVIASTATPDKNSLSTQTLGYTNLQNHAEYSGSTVGFSVSGSAGQSTPNGVNLSSPPVQAGSSTPGPTNSAGLGPSGVGAAGTSGSASGTTYAAVSPGTITVRGDVGTGNDSTAGLSRDAAHANGSVQNSFDAQAVKNDMAVQQLAGQVGMNVAGSVATYLQKQAIEAQAKALQDYQQASASGDTAAAAKALADLQAANQQAALWANDGAGRMGLHAVVAGAGAALGGGNVAGAVAGTVAGDMASNAVSKTLGDTLGANLVANLAAGAAGAAAGGALGGSAGAWSGANGALSADLYNRQLHPEETRLIKKLAQEKAQQICGGDATCVSNATVVWSDLLERTAKGLVDDQENAKNMAYLQALLQTANIPNSEGARGGIDAYIKGLQTAQDMLAPYMGKTITSANGTESMADGSAQTYFSATQAQRADSYANYVLGVQSPAPVAPGVDMRDQNRLERLATPNGSAQPVYTAEELLIGGPLAGKLLGTAGRVLESLDVSILGRATASSGGNISAQQITKEGLSLPVSAADRALLSQIGNLPSTALQGELREYVANNYFVRNGFTSLDGKCGSGNCFDGVYVKGNTVYINEVKPLNADGSIKLNGPSSGGLPTQMTDAWIQDALGRLMNGTQEQQVVAAQIQKAINSGTLVKTVTGVNSSGMTAIRIQ
ncbi:hemagglutinin repeat-containing protein [Ralstonia pseudosolanacearum]|uniref:hemagglutinin repeat-containing protein n=1 Tax=Ralstonia pseudosolanacearum TaxID=1310165 RepID=UPI0018D10614|nr:hemagglutinin repeat-containing protein [Ralstonia pseudosolanacearum]